MFEAPFNRARTTTGISDCTEKLCWCPCNDYFKIWRNSYALEYDIDNHRTICGNKSYSPQGLIEHLGTYRMKSCHYHRLLHLYLYFLYNDITKYSWRQIC